MPDEELNLQDNYFPTCKLITRSGPATVLRNCQLGRPSSHFYSRGNISWWPAAGMESSHQWPEYAVQDKGLFAPEEIFIWWKSRHCFKYTKPACPSQCVAKERKYFSYWKESHCEPEWVWIIPGIWVHLEIMQHTVPQCPSVKENFTEPGQTGETGPLGLARLLPGVFIGETEFEWQCQLLELKAVLVLKLYCGRTKIDHLILLLALSYE